MNLIGPVPIPSIYDQCHHNNWPAGPYEFHDANDYNEYFNPAIVEWRDRDWLLVRRRVGPPGLPGHNTIEAWKLKHNRPDTRHRLDIPALDPGSSAEDPRAFIRGNSLILMFCNFLPVQEPGSNSTGFASQAMTGISPTMIVEAPVRIAFGFNAASRDKNTGHEKNWTGFEYDGKIHISYSFEGRHIVVATTALKPIKIHYGKTPIWDYGTIRGGSCPVLHGDLYWTFVHSSLRWYCGKRRYFMGALAFEPKPPFNVVRMTSKPLLIASDRDRRNQWAPPCIWPGGAIMRDGQWLVSLGINDRACGWVQIPHKDLLNRCYVC
jgi:predicted GH43/DUF377 family glycosyl hydrolase